MGQTKTNSKQTIFSYDKEEDVKMAKSIATTLYRYDHIAGQRLNTLSELTEEHVKLFWDQGYLVVDQVLDTEEIQSATEAIMEAVYGKTPHVKVQYVKPKDKLLTDEDMELAARKVYEYIDYDPRLRAIAEQSALHVALTRLLGDNPKIVQDQAILKPPTGGAEKPWHQDMAYGNLAYDQSVIGVWMALDHAELDNGCMHVIPYSHRDGAVPHYAERDWQLCDYSVQVNKDVAVPLMPGGALFFSGLLHHGTPPNFSFKRRRALQIHYASESAEKLTPKEYKRLFTNAMTNAQC